MKEFNNRISYIDQLKGLAIFLVVIGHIYIFCLKENMASSLFLKWLSYIEMPLFLMLSGFMAYKKDTPNLFYTLRKKVITLILPFICVGSIYSFMITNTLNALWVEGIYHLGYWFTWTLFYYFVLYYSLDSIIRILNKKFFLTLDLIFWGLICLILQLIQKMELVPYSTAVFLSTPLIVRYFPFFIMGVLLKKYTQLFDIVLSKYMYTIFLCLHVILFIYIDIYFSNFIGALLLPISGIFVVFFLFKEKGEQIIGNKIFKSWGSLSLEIYLLHYFFLGLFPISNYSKFIMGNGLFFECIIVCSLALIIILLSLGTSWIIKQSSILEFFMLGNYSNLKSYNISYIKSKLVFKRV